MRSLREATDGTGDKELQWLSRYQAPLPQDPSKPRSAAVEGSVSRGMFLKLATYIKAQSGCSPEAEGYVCHDEQPEKVSEFCRRFDLPYSERFVSVGVFHPAENLLDERQKAKEFGEPVILDAAKVLPDLMLLCIGDMEGSILRAFDKEQLEEGFLDKCAQTMIDLSKMSVAKKLRVLRHAVLVKEPGGYAEARMHRALRKSDVLVAQPAPVAVEQENRKAAAGLERPVEGRIVGLSLGDEGKNRAPR